MINQERKMWGQSEKLERFKEKVKKLAENKDTDENLIDIKSDFESLLSSLQLLVDKASSKDDKPRHYEMFAEDLERLNKSLKKIGVNVEIKF